MESVGPSKLIQTFKEISENELEKLLSKASFIQVLLPLGGFKRSKILESPSLATLLTKEGVIPMYLVFVAD